MASFLQMISSKYLLIIFFINKNKVASFGETFFPSLYEGKVYFEIYAIVTNMTAYEVGLFYLGRGGGAL